MYLGADSLRVSSHLAASHSLARLCSKPLSDTCAAHLHFDALADIALNFQRDDDIYLKDV